MTKNIYIFFGPPGSGKGTQAEILSRKLKLPAISTGDLLRHEEMAGTALGKKSAKLLDGGKLVSDELIHNLVKERLAKADAKRGFILDGYPRNADQLTDFLTMISKADQIIIIEIGISDKGVMSRLSGRRVCDNGHTYHIVLNPPKTAGVCDVDGQKLYIRQDDKPAVIMGRLATYQANIAPMLALVKKRGKLVNINGEQPMEQVTADINKFIQ